MVVVEDQHPFRRLRGRRRPLIIPTHCSVTSFCDKTRQKVAVSLPAFSAFVSTLCVAVCRFHSVDSKHPSLPLLASGLLNSSIARCNSRLSVTVDTSNAAPAHCHWLWLVRHAFLPLAKPCSSWTYNFSPFLAMICVWKSKPGQRFRAAK